MKSSSSETVEENWEGVVSISQARGSSVFALTEDGCVLTNSEFHEKKVAGWENIVQLTCSEGHVFALKADGTVKVAWYENGCAGGRGRIHVSKWKDIRMISYSGDYIVGLKADGSTVFSGQSHYYGEKNLAVGQYEAVFTVGSGVVARQEDGSVNLSESLLGDFDPSACNDFICASGRKYAIRSDGVAVFFNSVSVDEPLVIDGYDFVSVSNEFGLTRSGEVYKFSYKYTGDNNDYVEVEKACTLSGVRLPSYPWAD